MKARNLLLPMGMVLAIVAPACTTAQDGSTGDLEAVKAQFVGHYELVIYESFRPNGEVVDMKKQDKLTASIREFNTYVNRDKRTENLIIPVGDGLTVCRKL